MAIVNWEYYNSLYSKVSQTEFTKAETLAEIEVKKVIGKVRFDDISADTYGYGELKDCICKVIDQMKDNQATSEHIGVSSVSNDGYSVSYGTAVTRETMSNELQMLIREELSGTGLVGAY